MQIRAGAKFIWEPPCLSPPPIYVRLTRVRRSANLVAAHCWQAGKHWKRVFPIPLPVNMRPADWTDEEIKESA